MKQKTIVIVTFSVFALIIIYMYFKNRGVSYKFISIDGKTLKFEFEGKPYTFNGATDTYYGSNNKAISVSAAADKDGTFYIVDQLSGNRDTGLKFIKTIDTIRIKNDKK